MAKQDPPQNAASAVISLPQPPLRKSEEYLKAYTNYAYTAISAISQQVASIELALFKKKIVNGAPETTRIYEHESLSLLHFVNPLTTFFDQVEATQIYLELTGEAFWVLLKNGKTPQEMWLVRPDWMKIVPDKNDIIKEYVYHPGGTFTDKVIIPKENVIHFKYFNPLNPYRGKGSVQAAALPLDTHNFAQEWNRNYFFNSAMPGLVFTAEKKLSSKVVTKFMEQWQASHGGRSKSSKIAFLGGGMKMEKATVGAKEMDFVELQRVMRDDILAVFKVPKSILGLTEDVNKANAEATNKAFMERVITPRMIKFVGALNEFLLPMYPDSANLFFDFTDPSPEDVELKLKKYANARRYTWMTPNEIRLEENLDPVEGGDDLFAPLAGGTSLGAGSGEDGDDADEDTDTDSVLERFGFKRSKKKIKALLPGRKIKAKPTKHMMPIPPKKIEEIGREKLQKSLTKDLTKMIGKLISVKNGEIVEKDSETEVEEPPKFRGTDSIFNEEGKDAYWKEFIEHATKHEDEIKDRAVDLFNEQEKVILDRLNEVKFWKKELRKGKESSVLPSIEELSRTWIPTFIPIIRDILIEQGRFVLDFLGVGGDLDMFTDTAVKFLRVNGAEVVTSINETNRNQLRETLADGCKVGESIPQLRIRVQGVYNLATKNRADMIARTESLRASNFATVEAYRQSDVVEAKEWLTERDDRVCPWCLEMDGKVVGLNKTFFKKGDKFTVGDKTLDIKLLDVGEPPLHVNCRCTTIPVLLGQKARVDERRDFEEALDKEKSDKAKLKKKVADYDKKEKKAAVVKSKAGKKAKGIVAKAEEDAEVKAKKIVKRAKKEAKVVLEEAEDEAVETKIMLEDQAEEEKQVVLAKAEKKANKSAATIKQKAVDESKTILSIAKKDGEKEKKGMVADLKKLRDKARKAIYGQKKS